MSKLPLTPLGRIIKRGGAQRVSKGAEKELSEYLEYVSEELTHFALKNAEDCGRKTLHAEDIEAAYRELF